MQFLRQHAMNVGISALFHLLVLACLALYVVEVRKEAERVLVMSELQEETAFEVPEDLEDEILELDVPVSMSNTTGPSGEVAQTTQKALPTQSSALDAVAAVSNPTFSRPLSSGLTGMSLDTKLSGLTGTMASAGGEEGMGAIHRITREIIRQLDGGKVIVCWVLDASVTVEKKREYIAGRIDRVYEELNQLGVVENKALLTAVVGFGQTTQFMLKQPTDSVPEIQQAINGIQTDESGVENVVAAVRETAQKYRKIQTAGQRAMMVICITDETGDDLAEMDSTAALLKRNNVRVYVVAPESTFSRPVVDVAWKDPKNGYTFYYPVNRGPESRNIEYLRPVFNGNAYPSGYGLFGLTQLCMQTGGMYFVDRLGQQAGFDFDYNVLLNYKPDYSDAPEYQQAIMSSPFRSAVFAVVSEGNKFWNPGPDSFFDDGNADGMSRSQRIVAPFFAFSQDAIPKMKQIEALREKEIDPRWRANFDLAYARLLQTHVRAMSWNWAYAHFKVNPREFPPEMRKDKDDPKLKERWRHGWYATFIKDLWIGQDVRPADRAKMAKDAKPGDKPKAENNVKRGGSETDLKLAEEYMATSRKYFQHLIDQHSGTPWAIAAKAEIGANVGVDILPGTRYIPTPEENKKRAETPRPKGL